MYFYFGTAVPNDFLFHAGNYSVTEEFSCGTCDWSYNLVEHATNGKTNILHKTQNTNNDFIKAEMVDLFLHDKDDHDARINSSHVIGLRGTTRYIFYGFNTLETYPFSGNSVFKIDYTVGVF